MCISIYITYTPLSLYIYIYMYVSLFALLVCVCMCMCLCVCVYVSMCACLYVCIGVHVCLFVCLLGAALPLRSTHTGRVVSSLISSLGEWREWKGGCRKGVPKESRGLLFENDTKHPQVPHEC